MRNMSKHGKELHNQETSQWLAWNLNESSCVRTMKYKMVDQLHTILDCSIVPHGETLKYGQGGPRVGAVEESEIWSQKNG